jgi:hypothetical protein
VFLPYVLFGVDDHSMQKIAMLLVWDSKIKASKIRIGGIAL